MKGEDEEGGQGRMRRIKIKIKCKGKAKKEDANTGSEECEVTSEVVEVADRLRRPLHLAHAHVHPEPL